MPLADRGVLMNQGRVQQIGAPMEIYDAPANAFVAGFIGSFTYLVVTYLVLTAWLQSCHQRRYSLLPRKQARGE